MKLTEKSLKRGLVFSVVCGAISILLVSSLTKTKLDWAGLGRISSTYFALAVALAIASWLAKTFRIQFLISAMGEKISTGRMLNIFLSACFVSHVTPMTGGGMPLQIYMLYRQGVNFGHTVAVSVVDSFLTALFYILAALLLLFVWHSRIGLSSGMVMFALGLIILACAFLLYLILKPEAVGSLTVKIGGSGFFRFLNRKGRLERWTVRVSQEVRRYREALSLLSQNRCSALWLAFAWTLVYWALYLAIVPTLLAGLNVSFDLVQVMESQLLLNFIQPFFPTPGASGGAELTFAFFFRNVVPKGLLGIFVMAWRLATYYLSLICGAVAIVYALRRGWLERNQFETATKKEQQ
jgi:hypothetical protein